MTDDEIMSAAETWVAAKELPVIIVYAPEMGGPNWFYVPTIREARHPGARGAPVDARTTRTRGWLPRKVEHGLRTHIVELADMARADDAYIFDLVERMGPEVLGFFPESDHPKKPA